MEICCWMCDVKYKSEKSIACSHCGELRKSSVPNKCENQSCSNHNVLLRDNENYCDLCAGLTTVGQMINKAKSR